jgi:hypothetical protein
MREGGACVREYVPVYPEIIPVYVTSNILFASYFGGSSMQIFNAYLN